MSDEAIYAWMAGDAEVAALVGEAIFPLIAPQGQKRPFIRYQVISDVGEDAYDSPSSCKTMRIQIDAYADTFRTARQVQAAVRRCLNGRRPDTGPVHSVTLVNRVDRYEGDDATRIYRSSQDYFVTYDEA